MIEQLYYYDILSLHVSYIYIYIYKYAVVMKSNKKDLIFARCFFKKNIQIGIKKLIKCFTLITYPAVCQKNDCRGGRWYFI